MPNPRRAVSAVAAALAVVVTGLGGAGAGASTPSMKSLAKDLMTSSYAKKAGFTEVAEKVSTTAKTGVKSCPDGAQEAFENTAKRTGVIAEVLVCTTEKAAAALLASVKAQGGTSSSAPKQLGASAVELSSTGPVYSIYWQQGAVFAFVGLETRIPASSSTTTTTAPAPPITAAEQKVLSGAAVNQFTRIG